MTEGTPLPYRYHVEAIKMQGWLRAEQIHTHATAPRNKEMTKLPMMSGMKTLRDIDDDTVEMVTQVQKRSIQAS